MSRFPSIYAGFRPIDPGSGGGGWADPVAEGADLVELQLHGLPRLDPAVELEATATGQGAGREGIAGLESLARGGVGQHRAKVMGGARGASLAPDLAIDPNPSRHRLPVRQLVGREQVGADRVGEGLR